MSGSGTLPSARDARQGSRGDLDIITLNANTWDSAKTLTDWFKDGGEDLGCQLPDVLCVQEHRIKVPGIFHAARAWTQARGYDMNGGLAISTGPKASMSSAGVATAVGTNIGAGSCKQGELQDHG